VDYVKSTDNGLTWSAPTTVSAGGAAVRAFSVWYDRWSNISADLIHIAWVDDTTDDVLYRNLNAASSDTLSSETQVFAGSTTAAGATVSITRARGGNLGCIFNIDAGAEDGFARSVDVGANWVAKADPTEAAVDLWIMLPGWGADNQDLICIFWDASADEISRKVYDDSADSWAETSISGSMSENASFANFAATVDITNSCNVLIAWNATDTSNADLLCWTVTEAAITGKTDVVTNGTDDQGFAGLGIDTDTGSWYAYYAGKSDGSEQIVAGIATGVNVYYKISTDSGATWGAETALTNSPGNLYTLMACPRFATTQSVAMTRGIPLVAVATLPTAGSTGISRARAFSGFH
jgi:hypothetical protein